MSILKKARRFTYIIRLYRNWIAIVLNRFGLHKLEYVYLRNRMKFKVKKISERGSITEIFLQKVYTKFYKIKNNDVVIDIGASIGDFAVFAATSAKNVKVFSFDSDKDSFERLLENISINRCKNVKVRNVCVGDSKGCVSIEKILKSVKKCDLLKMDCEGCEFDILNTPKQVLRRVKNIAMEGHYFGKDCKNIVKYLKTYGFKVRYEGMPKSKLCFIYAKRLGDL